MNGYNNYFSNPYGYTYGPSMSSGMELFIVIASLVITVLAIVAFILCYRKYLGKNADVNSGFSKLLRFDHLYINKIIQILYLACVITITATALGIIVVSCAAGFVGFLAGLFSAALFFVLMQLAVRVAYEIYIVFIRIGRDVGAVRKKFVSEEELEENEGSLTGGSFFSSKKKYSAPAGGAMWKCSCGAVNTGNFCTVCGLAKPAQAAAPAAAPAKEAPKAEEPVVETPAPPRPVIVDDVPAAAPEKEKAAPMPYSQIQAAEDDKPQA